MYFGRPPRALLGSRIDGFWSIVFFHENINEIDGYGMGVDSKSGIFWHGHPTHPFRITLQYRFRFWLQKSIQKNNSRVSFPYQVLGGFCLIKNLIFVVFCDSQKTDPHGVLV